MTDLPKAFKGRPGTRWTNRTGKVRWQLVVNWTNSCIRCISFDHSINVNKWPVPFHPFCRCVNLAVLPGHTARPFKDFKAELAKLPPHRLDHVAGKTVARLVAKGILRWEDAVTPDRVKTLAELVAEKGLGVKQLRGAGLSAARAAQVHAAGQDTAARIAEAHRVAREAEIAAKAEAQRAAKEETRKRLAAREAKIAGRPKRPAGPTSAERAARASAAHLAQVHGTTTGYLRRAGVKLAEAHEAGLQARAEADLGVKFVAAPGASGKNYRTVVIDVGKVDADLARHPGFHVTPGGGGAAIEGRYEQFGTFYGQAKAAGKPVEMPRLAVADATGDISVADGRHRLAWLRDHGATSVPVRVPKGDEAKIRQRYGYVPPTAEEAARRKAEAEAQRLREAGAAKETKAKAKVKAPKLTAAEKKRLAAEEAAARTRAEAEAGLDAAQVELRRRMEAAATQNGRFQVVHDWLRENHGPARPVQEHGMAAAEDLHPVEYGGRTYWIPPVSETYVPGVGHPLAYRIVAELQNPAERLPARLREATKEVVFTKQANKDDEYWRKVYNDPNHVSGATGGDEKIVIYNSHNFHYSTDAHESGHNLAVRIYGGTMPTPGSDYYRAIRSGEPPVTAYAANSDAEDFAESWEYYVRYRERLRREHPERYAVIHRLATDPHYKDGGAEVAR